MFLMTAKSALVLMVASSALVLAGCSGSTYGTGQTQQEMLFSDINGMVPLGNSKKKERIVYTSRPKLVPPPTTASLQPPSETTQAADAFFPVNPEEARAARLSALDEAEAQGRTGQSIGIRSQQGRYTPPPVSPAFREKDTPAIYTSYDSAKEAEDSKKRLARMRQIQGTGGLGTAPRRYLTQPPVEYRTPAETAEVGNVGKREKSDAKKKSPASTIFPK
ncbi:MAG: hypothetical protein AAGI12_04985 [Pseudomonadota bacterium]